VRKGAAAETGRRGAWPHRDPWGGGADPEGDTETEWSERLRMRQRANVGTETQSGGGLAGKAEGETASSLILFRSGTGH